MHMITQFATKTTTLVTAIVLGSAILFTSDPARAQMAMRPSQPAQAQAQPDTATQARDTQAQINQLKQQVAQLQAALQQSKAKKPASTKGSMGATKPAMGMEDDSSEMGGMSSRGAKSPMAPMKDDMDEMGAMATSGGAMKDGSATPMAAPGCCGMSMGKPMPKSGGMADDKMGGMSGSGMPSKGSTTMSKTAEAPHLLHVGAKNFFLDHAQHIGLTHDQRTSLMKFKSDAVQQKAASQKKIDVAEQELWQLTSADQPDTVDIDKKIQEIAKLRADQQMAFIHAVSAASDVLTPEQRTTAVKTMASANAGKSPMPKQPMKME
jgi:Spy/CpxP family protein refolding chaperone